MSKKIQITDKELKQIEAYASRGLSDDEICDALGIGRTTFYKNKKVDPNIADTIKKGRAKGKGVVTNKLFEKIEQGNLTAMIFWLKCHGWKEINATELTGKDGQAMEHAHGLTSPARRFMDRLSEHAKKLGAKRIDKGDTES